MMKEERIVRVLEAFGEPIMTGGQESFVFGVMEKMDMTGLAIDCLTAYEARNDRYKALVESKGGRIYSLNLPFAPGKSRGNIKKPFEAFLQSHSYDIVHIHSGSISVLAIMASVADKAGVKKVIVHSHSTGENDDIKHKLLRKLASSSLRKHVDVYCACSKSAAEWKFESKYADKALIIKNGIDTERFSFNETKREYWRKKLGLTDKFVVGHVGRFSHEKNHPFLIDVFEKIAEIDEQSRLLLVGDGEEMDNIQKLVKDNGLTDKVIFTGSVSNVEDYLQAMDVFVLPSLFEGFGIAAIEAEAAGLPVVASQAVPRDTAISTIEFMMLGDSDTWVDALLKYRDYTRTDGSCLVRGAGYDMSDSVSSVLKMYRL